MKHLILPLLAIGLNGCAPAITGTDAVKVANAIGHIEPSKKDTCDTQRQIAAQSSRIDTIKTGTETVYKAPCVTDKKPVPASPTPETS